MGAGGLELYYQRWLPTTTPQGLLGLVHGLGSHSSSFNRLVPPLVESNYGVYGLDLRGHGRSPGRRGYVRRWADFQLDLASFHRQMVLDYPDCPCFLLGHSLGAVIVLDYGLHSTGPLAGLIAMAPAIGPVGVAPLKLMLGRILSCLWPTFTLQAGIPEQAGSHDPSVLAAYAADPLRHTQGTARLVAEFLAAAQRVRSQLSHLPMPLLILQGDEDAVALPTGSRSLFDQLNSGDVEYREYPHGYHDLHNDNCSSQVAGDILGWLNTHISGQIPMCRVR